MSVRAKLYVHTIEKTLAGSTVKFGAVCRGAENKEWAAATPNAQLTMTILNEVAAQFFEVGQEYHVDFTPAGTQLAPVD